MGGHWHQHGDSIEGAVLPTHLEKFSADINLKALYNDIVQFFINYDFKDILGPDSGKGKFFDYAQKQGEPMDNKEYLNRTPNMFEKHFLWSKKADGTVEFELRMQARRHMPFSPYGWIELKIELVNRRIVNKEILLGNDKKVVQSGAWENRNNIVYKNSVITDYLNNIPYVKNHPKLKEYYVQFIYSKYLDADIHFAEKKIKKKFYDEVIFKHFSHRDISTL